jgi:hypothetical protein
MLILMIVLIWITLAVLIGAFGRHRSMGFWGYFFASLVLTPVLGLLLVLVSGKRSEAE